MELLWNEEIPGYEPAFHQERPLLDVFYAKKRQQGRNAAVIVCPGGGYSRRAAKEGEPVARWLNDIGITAFVLHYRFAPYRYPYPQMDAERALRYVRYHADRFQIDPDKIGILGFSAGGHLAAAVATGATKGDYNALDPIDRLSARPNALVLCYPVISFDEYREKGSVKNLLGEHPDPKLLLELSVEKRVSKETPPTFIWHTANDKAVMAANSLIFAQALSEHEVPYELHVFHDGPHGQGLALKRPHLAVWTDLCKNWLADLGWINLDSPNIVMSSIT